MPRYLLNFFRTHDDLVKDNVSAIAGADSFTDAILEALSELGKHDYVMIVILEGQQVKDYLVLNLGAITDLLRDWDRDGVFDTL